MSVAAASPWITVLGIPGLLALGGFIAWAIRSTIEDYRDAERQLTTERRTLYQQVLEPFLLPLIMADDQAEAVAAMQEEAFASAEYKRAVFEMTLFASDAVVRAFGDITNSGNNPSSDPMVPMVLWARLLLAIRKSVGNKGSQLSLVDMLRPTIKDVDASPEFLKALKEAE
jgi:hypothetical protein